VLATQPAAPDGSIVTGKLAQLPTGAAQNGVGLRANSKQPPLAARPQSSRNPKLIRIQIQPLQAQTTWQRKIYHRKLAAGWPTPVLAPKACP